MSEISGTSISKYPELKSRGLITPIKKGSSYAVKIRRFSPEDGSEQLEITQALSVSVLETERANLQSMIDGINALLEDFAALDT